MQRLSETYGYFLTGLAAIAAILLFAMTIIICADVALRNLPLAMNVRGIFWSSDVTESMLYLITVLCAPWLLRQGQHIRVDILLQIMPKSVAWYIEWVVDLCIFVCCVLMAYYGLLGLLESFESGSVTIRALITPEWWSLVPMPLAFLLLAIEVVFRMHRLYLSDRTPRNDAVSAA